MRQALRDAEGIIDLIAEFDMVMTLPKGIPTLQHMRSKKYSRPDNFFCNTALQPYVIKSEVQPQHKPSCTDHYPIVTHLDLPQAHIPEDPSYNFRTADWEAFNKALKVKLGNLPRPGPITDLQQLTATGDSLTKVLQETIEEIVTRSKPRPDMKHWWNSDLTGMRKELNRLLLSDSYKNRTLTNHASHRELRKKSRIYGKAIISAKRAHWAEYLEDMVASDIWTANKYLKEPVGDGGLPRIPTIRVKDAEGLELEINDNEDKAKIFVKSFFPPPPATQEDNLAEYVYPEPLQVPPSRQSTHRKNHSQVAIVQGPWTRWDPQHSNPLIRSLTICFIFTRPYLRLESSTTRGESLPQSYSGNPISPTTKSRKHTGR
jgi:hypothetical protein